MKNVTRIRNNIQEEKKAKGKDPSIINILEKEKALPDTETEEKKETKKGESSRQSIFVFLK